MRERKEKVEVELEKVETKVEKLLKNEPGYISGRLPDTLVSGTYRIVVKTQVGSSNQLLTELRIGSSNFSLTVV